jgi:iron complex outermembrane recepter protein
MELLPRLARSLSSRLRSTVWSRLFALVLTVALPLATHGQTSTGALTGTAVSSANGNFLEGAEVSIDALGLRANTGRGGVFTLTGIPAGSHVVAVNYPGLETYTTTVEVSAGETATLVARLSSEVYQLESFKVQGSREGMSQAVALQRVSIQTKMVAAADQFGEISEGNIGEYLKFMPGVSIDYNVNDARGISLRGLSTAFTVVAVDGTPMAGSSSVDDTRRFEFEQIAMNNVETTELFKTVTPDIPANATGGFVNFVTKSAFDHEEQQRITYNLSFTAPSSNFSLSKQGGVWGQGREYVMRPSLELNLARKVNPKLGINMNYRFSERYDDSPRTEFTWVTATTAPTVMTNPRLQQYNIRDEQKLTHREAFATKVDYKLSDRTSLMVSGQWNWYDLHFTQRGPQFVLGTGSVVSGANTFTSGASGANINNGVLYRNKYGTTWHFNGNLSHEFTNGAKLSVTPYYSRADGHYRDTSKGFISSVAQMSPSSTTYTNFTLADPMTLGVLPTITLNRAGNPVPLSFIRDLGNYRLTNTATGGNFQSRPWTAIDEKEGFRADYTQEFNSRLPFTLTTGIALDLTDRYIHRPDIRWVVPATTGAALTALADQGYTSDVGYGFGSFQVVNPFLVWETFQGGTRNVVADDFRNFIEENRAVYLKVTDKLLLVGGVRWENRDIEAQAQSRTNLRSKLAVVDLDYSELYPSLSFKYNPKRHIVIRGGASRTVGHPDYSDLLPVITSESLVGAGDGSIVVPDPALKPYFSSNYDLSLDYFLKNSGVLGVYAFRKDVKNYFISRGMTATERNAIATEYGYNPTEFNTGTVRENGGKSTLQGIELSYAQSLTMLPAPFNGLNIQANFTYVDVTSKDPNPLVALDTFYSQMRAVSPKTANLVVGYRYRDLRVTVTNNWVDESLYGGFVATNYFTGSANPTNQAADTRLTLNKDEKLTTDIKLEWAFSKKLAAYFLVRNVFNTPRREFLRGYLPQYQNVVLPLRYFEFGEPHYTFGIRGTF